MPYVHCKWVWPRPHLHEHLTEQGIWSGMSTRIGDENEIGVAKDMFHEADHLRRLSVQQGNNSDFLPFKDTEPTHKLHCLRPHDGLMLSWLMPALRALILEQVSITHVRPYCRSFLYISLFSGVEPTMYASQWFMTASASIVHLNHQQQTETVRSLLGRSVWSVTEHRILSPLAQLELSRGLHLQFPLFYSGPSVGHLPCRRGVDLSSELRKMAASAWNLLEEVAWLFSIGSRCGICIVRIHGIEYIFQHYQFLILYGNTAKLLNWVLARSSRSLSYLRWRLFFALLWPCSSAFGGSSCIFKLDWYHVLSSNRYRYQTKIHAATVYCIRHLRFWWPLVWSCLSPFFQLNLDPFHEGWIKKHCWTNLLSKSCRPWSRFTIRFLLDPVIRCQSAVLSSHNVLGGVMQAPSAVESDMSCWPVYIYVVCLNYCILKCGSIQQRKGMQSIAARLIKTALNIKLKNKTLKDIELAP